MSERTIYLLRHCETVFPGAPGKRYIGKTDIPLSPAGAADAVRLGKSFSGLPVSGVPIASVFSSGLRRSRDTARVISDTMGGGLPVQEVADFAEIDLGEWDGKLIEEVRSFSSAEYELRGRSMETYRPPGGESFGDLSLRVFRALDSVIARSSGDIMIVGHGGMNRVILCRLLGIPLNDLFSIPQDLGCVNVIGWGKRPEVRLLNGGPDWKSPAGEP